MNSTSEKSILLQHFSKMIKTVAKAERRLYYRDQTPKSLTALVQLVHHYQPTKIIELGTLSGMSLRAWLHAGGHHEIIAIDLSFQYLMNSQKILPIDLSKVTLIEQNIMTVDFSKLWHSSDRVLLYIDAHDLPNVPIMAHILNSVVPLLPKGSIVAIDDLWYSKYLLSASNALTFFDQVVIPQFDPIIFRELFYAPYWKGGSFVGFQEVIPLMEWAHRNFIEFSIQDDVKMVSFQLPQANNKKLVSHSAFNAQSFQQRLGRVGRNPVDCFSSVQANTKKKKQALDLCQKGIHLFAQDDYSHAFAYFQSAQKLSPEMRGLSYALAVCLARVGQFDAAIASLNLEIALHFPYEKASQLLHDLKRWPDIEPLNQFSNNHSVTLFTTLKPFQGHIQIIQRNAIISWTKLQPKPEIILFGNEPGTSEIAQELNLIHVPDVKCNKNRLPYINDMFYRAQSIATNNILVYINGDIILTSDFMPSIEIVKNKFDTFLMVGRRWNVPIDQLLDDHPDWEKELRDHATAYGSLHNPTGMDYFVFTKYLWPQIPSFVVGRAGWDNGMVSLALADKNSVIDSTQDVVVYHQQHHYNHLKGGEVELREGIDAKRNFELLGGLINVRTTVAANWMLSKKQLIKKPNVLIITSYPDRYLENVYVANSNLQFKPFEEQIKIIIQDELDECYNFSHLTNLGHNVQLIIANNRPAQVQWLKENQLSINNQTNWIYEIISKQIETYQFEVVFFVDPFLIDSLFIRQWKFMPRLIMGWMGREKSPEVVDLEKYDIILSNFKCLLNAASKYGAKATEFFITGFPIWLTFECQTIAPSDDVIFIGNWSNLKDYQKNMIKHLARVFITTPYKLSLYLSGNIDDITNEMSMYLKGECFGKIRYKIIQNAKIFINFDFYPESGNVSFFEVTGFGRLLLTEYQKNTHLYFQPGKEIETFKNETELTDKILYYLMHQNHLKKIAIAGQHRCFKEYSMGQRIHQLSKMISKSCGHKNPLPVNIQNDSPSRKLKCSVLCSYYHAYLYNFYNNNTGLQSQTYETQLRYLIDDCFGDSDFYSNGLKMNGWDATDIITNCAIIQKQWTQENNCSYEGSFKTFLEQIKSYHPDVVYIHDLSAWGQKEMLSAIRPFTKLIVGQIAYPLSEQTDICGFDIIFSSFPHYVERFRQKGVSSYYIPLAFDPRVLDKIGKKLHRKYPVTFIGGISSNHQKGIDILEQICQRTRIDLWGYGINTIKNDLCIKKCHHGEAWGLEMFTLMAQSKIAINRHIDVAENYANNMRLYEATGCGALLITDYKDNLNDLFEIGKEVIAYRSPEECVDLIDYYLNHPQEAERIARAGQEKTLRDHTYVNRMAQISEILKRHLA
ncbi:MAG: glycosyltransferase [Candidatus Magnetomorum sp.]|nr:glycosyltransferase [Candidatus Magnetomorum sp.]